MPDKEEFLRYADEAMRSAVHAKTNEEKQAFLDMARTWGQAAAQLNGNPIPELLKAH